MVTVNVVYWLPIQAGLWIRPIGSKGRRPLALFLHSSREPSELSQLL